MKVSNIKKILIVAPAFSIHTIKWIEQINDQNWEIHLFSSYYYSQLNKSCKNITYHSNFYVNEFTNEQVKYKSIDGFWHKPTNNKFFRLFIGKLFRLLKLESNLEESLLKIIKTIQPDIIHTMDTQNSGYLYFGVLKKFNYKPIWINSVWGSDLFLYQNFDDHLTKIKNLLKSVDFLIVEGHRDKKIAQQLGFKNKIEVFQATGGLDLKSLKVSIKDKPSKRTNILIKGEQSRVRFAVPILLALENCISDLQSYQICILNADNGIMIQAKVLEKKYGLSFKFIDSLPHKEIFDLLRSSRFCIINNLSDGIPNFMLECMAVGTFPIVSNTSMAEDWIENGVNGILTDPLNVQVISSAISLALNDDELVDNAVEKNYQIIKKNFDRTLLKPKIVDFYKKLLI